MKNQDRKEVPRLLQLQPMKWSSNGARTSYYTSQESELTIQADLETLRPNVQEPSGDVLRYFQHCDVEELKVN